MDTGHVHVAAACFVLALGALVLLRPKGGATHVVLGRLFLAGMLLVDVPVLLLYEATGRPGPFHVLAVVSLTTTSLGWLALRRRRVTRDAVGVHAALMTWSWVGVVTAGLAQFANRTWPDDAPWPVLLVVAVSTGAGLLWVPRYVARQLARRTARGAGR